MQRLAVIQVGVGQGMRVVAQGCLVAIAKPRVHQCVSLYQTLVFSQRLVVPVECEGGGSALLQPPLKSEYMAIWLSA